jgi:hypothetical protein
MIAHGSPPRQEGPLIVVLPTLRVNEQNRSYVQSGRRRRTGTILRSVQEREVAGWVWPSNVERLLFWASHYVGYNFDGLDWQAVETALPATDDEREDGWYEYPLVGEPPLRVRLARAVGAAPVTVVVTGEMDEPLASRIATLFDVFSDAAQSG